MSSGNYNQGKKTGVGTKLPRPAPKLPEGRPAGEWATDPGRIRQERDHYRECYFTLLARLSDVEKESARRAKELSEMADPMEKREDGKMVQKDRWKWGFASIVGILHGDHYEYEIEDIVEEVRCLKQEKR